jgi:hypothetical protein
MRTPSEVWLTISSDLLRGLNHLLSNRVSALGAVTQLLAPAEQPDDEMLATLGVEVGRLERTLRLLRMVPREATARAEPVRVEERLPDVLAMHEHHPVLRDVPCELSIQENVAPVWIAPAVLSHAALTLLTGAKQIASSARERAPAGGRSPAGPAGAVTIRCEGSADGTQVLVRLESVDAAGAPGANGLVRRPPEGEIGKAAEWIVSGGFGTVAELVRTGPGADTVRGFELSLVTLAEQRKRERAQAAKS